ncbi:MAG TPA: phosphoenolpyruvate--protein phosphotransferase [Steroidobacteraceae bacterium]|nr:phosphoenolpyruvate--protein phosphotransferase [Steroidobacteraceae bacterium]
MANLTLVSPLRGWCAPLDETPDAVFAQRLLGDGVAIDPTAGVLHAPCEGEVISVAAAGHAVALRAANGAEILLHVGIDTVALGGEGFEALVAAGARVRSGEPLLSFDLDVLAQRAKSLITPIVVTNGDRFSIVRAQCERAVEVGDPLFELQPAASADKVARPAPAHEVTGRVTLAHDHGIHARPAALIANFAKTSPAEIAVAVRGRKANAKSAVALMSLGAQRGDELTVTAAGDGADAAVEEIKRLVLSLDASAPAAHSAPKPQPAVTTPVRQTQPNRLRGVIASRGLAVGRAVPLQGAEVQVAETGKGIAHESAEFERARAEVRTRLEQIASSAHGTAREVIAAHLEFLDDWELVAAARRAIARGKSAGFAWRRAVRESADTLRALGDARMSERVDDLLDLESQVLLTLNGEAPIVVRNLPERAILIAEDLKPSQLVSLDATRLAGICLAAGGPTSHVAILAAAMGVPALVALGPAVLEVAEGAWLILDAEQGNLATAPDQTALAAAEQTLAARQQRKQAERAAAHADCRTADGVRIEVLANLGSLAEAQVAIAHGAEGCGLLRTEFLFLDREAPPDEAEQLQQYQGIATVLDGRPLVIRTLDIGGDKPIPYLPLPAEPNPALGLRGVRTSLWRPDLLRVQLRAILRVQPAGQCRVLLPMITDTAEITAVRRMIDEARRELRYSGSIAVGAMIETPAAALLAERVANEVEFLSIGTNDLTQYTLAMDRGHSELAHRIDGLHPAVLRLIATTVNAAEKYSRFVAVCGGLASEPAAVPVLLGLGVHELSVVPTLIPQLKSLIRTLTLDSCRSLAQRALALDTAEAVRELVNEFSASESQVAS